MKPSKVKLNHVLTNVSVVSYIKTNLYFLLIDSYKMTAVCIIRHQFRIVEILIFISSNNFKFSSFIING